MTEQSNTKPMSWLTIILILVVVSFATGLLFSIVGTFFDLPPSLTRGALPAVVGVSAAFLIVRRKSAIDRRNNR